jgi:hypothetical protein
MCPWRNKKKLGDKQVAMEFSKIITSFFSQSGYHLIDYVTI